MRKRTFAAQIIAFALIGVGGMLLGTLRADLMPQDYWSFVQSFGASGSGAGQFSGPRGVAIGPDNNLYIADASNRIEVFQQNGQFVRQWSVTNPQSLAFGPDGNLYVGYGPNYTGNGGAIRVYSTTGTLIRQWGTSGSGNGQFAAYDGGWSFPWEASIPGIAVGTDGTVFALDPGNSRVQVFTSNGTFVRTFGTSGAAPGQFGTVRGIAFGPDGNLYTAEEYRIQIFDKNGQFIRQFPTGVYQFPFSLAVGPDGNIFAGYWAWPERPQPFTFYRPDGTFLRGFGDAGSGMNQFNGQIYGIAVSPNGKLFVSDSGNCRIQVLGRNYRSISSSAVPQPFVQNVQQRPATTYLDIDYKVTDSDSPTLEVYPLGFLNGTKDLSHVIPMVTFVEGTDANKGAGVTSGTTHRLSWNASADWSANYGELKVEVLANDGRSILPLEFITLPASGPNPQLKISRSPYGNADFLSLWFWLIAKRDSAISLVNGQVIGVGGNYGGQVLASGTATTASGRAFLFERLNVRVATSAEVTRAKNGPNTNLISQWTPLFAVGPGDFPRNVNEYGFDTGAYDSDYYWVVSAN